MNESERALIQSAIDATRAALNTVDIDLLDENLIGLYDSTKTAHNAALSIWAVIVTILRARKGLDQQEPGTDAINLEELFGSSTEKTNG